MSQTSSRSRETLSLSALSTGQVEIERLTEVAEHHQCVKWQIDVVNDKVREGPKHRARLCINTKRHVDRSVKALMPPKQCGGHLIKALSYAVGPCNHNSRYD
jgi:hypothetical protein